MRFTRIPAKNAASSCAPVANIARPGRVQHDRGEDGGHDEQRERIRDRGARDGLRGQVRVVLRELGHRLGPEHDVREPAVERQRADRDGQ
jgi:hypothetical protein